MKIRNMIASALLLLGLLGMNSHAAEQLYEIELVLFAQEMPSTEVFDQTESLIKWPREVFEQASFPQLDSERITLHESVAKLADELEYQIVMHVAWIQAVVANRLGDAVQISNSEGTVNGFFRLQRGNLIHMVVDIEYAPEPYAGGVFYRLNEKRRFKLNETHYLDHPKFGILARVSPMKPEQ
jgi:hypothetical protein